MPDPKDRERTMQMIQKAIEYVPEHLRPSGLLERQGFYKNPNSMLPIADKQYDTQPFDHLPGGIPSIDIENWLRKLLFGDDPDGIRAAHQAAIAARQAEIDAAQRAEEAPFIGELNRESNRFAEQGRLR